MANKQFLLDTHIFLWWMQHNEKLSKKLLQILRNSNHQVFISTATVWEIIIKKKMGKLKVPSNLNKGIVKSNFEVLPINLDHVLELEKLPLHHKDPFDRILIAQARVEKLVLLTGDQKIKHYQVDTINP